MPFFNIFTRLLDPDIFKQGQVCLSVVPLPVLVFSRCLFVQDGSPPTFPINHSDGYHISEMFNVGGPKFSLCDTRYDVLPVNA